MRSMIQRWLRRRLGVDESDVDDDPDDDGPERGLLVRKGQFVALRTHVSANREAFQRWYGDQEIAELLRHDLEPLNDVQSRNYFDTFIMPSSARGDCFAIHERRSKRLIGTTALTDRSTSKNGVSALFRIVIGEKDSWGRGYGTEATRLVMEEAFEALGLSEVRLEVFSHNERAMAAYRRVGFEVTGEHVEWVPRRNVELRVIEMRLKREAFGARSHEWPASQRGAASKGYERDRAERAAQRTARKARREARHDDRRGVRRVKSADAGDREDNTSSD
jgi:RimJ/RimL family protein N-acetyltransferase